MSEQYTSSINSLLKKKPYKNKFSRSNYNTIFSTQESKKYIILLIVSKNERKKGKKKKKILLNHPQSRVLHLYRSSNVRIHRVAAIKM